MVDLSADRPPIRILQALITYSYPINDPCAPTFELFPMWVKNEPAQTLEDVLLDRQWAVVFHLPYRSCGPFCSQSLSGLALHCAILVGFCWTAFPGLALHRSALDLSGK